MPLLAINLTPHQHIQVSNSGNPIHIDRCAVLLTFHITISLHLFLAFSYQVRQCHHTFSKTFLAFWNLFWLGVKASSVLFLACFLMLLKVFVKYDGFLKTESLSWLGKAPAWLSSSSSQNDPLLLWIPLSLELLPKPAEQREDLKVIWTKVKGVLTTMSGFLSSALL